MNVKDLHKSTEFFPDTEKMPVLFIGHGNPMNAIDENEFVAGWRNLGRELHRVHLLTLLFPRRNIFFPYCIPWP